MALFEYVWDRRYSARYALLFSNSMDAHTHVHMGGHNFIDLNSCNQSVLTRLRSGIVCEWLHCLRDKFLTIMVAIFLYI